MFVPYSALPLPLCLPEGLALDGGCSRAQLQSGLDCSKLSQKKSLWNEMFPVNSQSVASLMDSTASVWEVGGYWEMLLQWGRGMDCIDQCP